MANTTEDLGYSGSWHYTSAMGQAVLTKKKDISDIHRN